MENKLWELFWGCDNLQTCAPVELMVMEEGQDSDTGRKGSYKCEQKLKKITKDDIQDNNNWTIWSDIVYWPCFVAYWMVVLNLPSKMSCFISLALAKSPPTLPWLLRKWYLRNITGYTLPKTLNMGLIDDCPWPLPMFQWLLE